MRSSRVLSATVLALTLLLLGAAAVPAKRPASTAVPPIVFVSRGPILFGAVPGMGPGGRCTFAGGKLRVRERDGRVRDLVSPERFRDVSDPSTSWDGRRVVFAGIPARDSVWSLWLVDADGRNLKRLTSPVRIAEGGLRRRPRGFSDDIDPCWLPDDRIVFASTRLSMVAQLDGLPVTNLWTVNADGSGLIRLTTERNGAEEPTVEPANGRITYARWWTNRWLGSDTDPRGVTLDSARGVPQEEVNLWQAISIRPDGERMRLAGGDARGRASLSAYQPVLLADSTLVGVRTERLSMLLPHGRPGLQIFPHGFAAPIRVGGGDTAVCAPAALPDGRLVVSLARPRSNDFGLWLMSARGKLERPLLDLPHTNELDACVLAPRPRPPVMPPMRTFAPDSLPVTDKVRLLDKVHTFRFDCLNVFATGGLDGTFPDAPPLQPGVRIRFFATLSRPADAGGDTVILVRESAVTPTGGIHEDDMPADVPMFEQLVDAHGKLLRSPRGPAHVAGLNFAPFGAGTQCVGCHVGHSALPAPLNYSDAQWVNASPSAQATASSVAEGSSGARAVADRRTQGPSGAVGWVARGAEGEFVRLAWASAIEVRELLIYALAPLRSEGTDLRVGGAQVVLFRDGREVEKMELRGPLSPRGSRLDCRGIRLDALEVRPLDVTGQVAHRTAAGLSEIVTVAKLAYP